MAPQPIECITLSPAWYDGRPVEPGALVVLSESDAAYAESIGRVVRVQAPAESLAPSSAD